MNKNDKKPLAMESLPTAKGFVIWISSAMQAAFYHSVTHKPPDYKNNGTCMAVIKLLSVVITGGSRVVVFSGGLQLHFTTKGREMQ